MQHQWFPTLLLFLSLCLAPNALADEPADSLAFEAKRRQILEHSPDERATLTLDAAEDLARDGYYIEALDLIFSMEEGAPASLDWDPDSSDLDPDAAGDTLAGSPADKAPRSPPPYASTGSGYVQSSLGYDAWEGLDTTVSGRIRTKLQWDRRGRLVERITTVFQGSDRNAYFDLAAKGAAFRRMFKFEGDMQAEKRLWQAYGDSLDRLSLLAKLEGNTRALGKPLSLVAPVFAEAQQYRFDNRPGSLSYQAFGAMPGLEAISADLRKSLFLSWELRRTDFPSAASTGNFRNGPVASAEWYGERITLDAETRFQTTRYQRDSSLYRLRQLETRAGVFARLRPWLRAGIRARGGTESEEYRDSVEFADFNRIPADYRLRGSTLMVQPQLVGEWASSYSFSLSLAYTQARFPILSQVGGSTLQSSRYVEESYDDWKPEAGVTILTKAIFLTLSANYQENTVPYAPLDYTLESSKGFGLNGNLFWKVRPWLEIDFTGMASHRFKGTKKDRIQDIRSMSLGLTSRFQ